MKERPKVLYYHERLRSVLPRGDRGVIGSVCKMVDIPDALAGELFYLEDNVWKLYSNSYDIVAAWNIDNKGLPLILFSEPQYEKFNPLFPVS